LFPSFHSFSRDHPLPLSSVSFIASPHAMLSKPRC
jgi:hypothetical protein